jgi:hypothetical protein
MVVGQGLEEPTVNGEEEDGGGSGARLIFGVLGEAAEYFWRKKTTEKIWTLRHEL